MSDPGNTVAQISMTSQGTKREQHPDAERVKRAAGGGGGGGVRVDQKTVTARDSKGVRYGLTPVPCVDNITCNDILTRNTPPCIFFYSSVL